jgi:ABC-type amino acid transport substrate-binding protein
LSIPRDRCGVFTVDYIRLLEQKLGIRFQVVAPNDLTVNLEKARFRDVDVLTSLMKTPERSGYLLFTKPYVTVPAVIIIRKGFTGPVTLDRMQGV